MDAIEQLTKQIKALQKKIDELEATGKNSADAEARLKTLEDRMAKTDPDFDDWG